MISDDRIKAIYDELEKYIISTDLSQARDLGPAYLQDQMALCRNYLNFVSLLFTEVSRAKWEVGAAHRVAKDVYKLEYDSQLATCPEVRNLANIADRKSTVAFKLRDKEQEINHLAGSVVGIEAVLKVVMHRTRELHSTMDTLKEQRRLMDSDIRSGAMYGDERTTHPAKAPKDKKKYSAPMEDMGIDDLTDEDLEQAAGGLSTPVAVSSEEPQAAEPATPPPVVTAVSTSHADDLDLDLELEGEAVATPAEPKDDEIEAFLQSGDPPKEPQRTEEDDLSDFLASI